MCQRLSFAKSHLWFKCTNLDKVPALTLSPYKDLKNWDTVDKLGARTAIRKLDLHLDYLAGRNVIFSFASKEVRNEEKGEMAKRIMPLEKKSKSI